MQKTVVAVLLLPLFFQACVQKKQLQYMQDVEKLSDYSPPKHEYVIQPGDLLYVRILTIDMAFHEMFEPDTRNRERVMTNEAGLFIEGYSVNEQGYIKLPLLNDIHVAGHTTEGAKKQVQKKVDELFKDAKVDLKLLNFKVTVMGEVVRPGVYNNYLNQFTLFDALAKAGNITEYGNRRNVLIMRQGNKGTSTMHVDLTSAGVLQSEAYYLRPNDVIIVEPNTTRVFSLNVPTFSFAFSAISTFLLLLNFFK